MEMTAECCVGDETAHIALGTAFDRPQSIENRLASSWQTSPQETVGIE